MYLCICKAVSDKQIQEAVERGARSVGDVSARFGVGNECGKCLDSIREFIDRCLAAPAPAPALAVLEIAPVPVVVATVDTVPAPATQDNTPQRAAWFAIDL